MSFKHITEDEYNDWFKTADKIIESDHATFTSCCGPHEFSSRILKNGTLYELRWGWSPEEDMTPGAKYKYKDVSWWGVKELYKEYGQNGEGI